MKMDITIKHLIDLVEEYNDAIDTEMEHGDYHAAECIPPQYEDEDNYYARHNELVDRACDCWDKIREFIKAYEQMNGKGV